MTNPTSPTPPPTYDVLLAAARRDPAQADFHSLRMAYARSDAYSPYAHDTEHTAALQTALRSGAVAAALTAIEHLLAWHYLDIEAHLAAAHLHTRRGDADRAAYHAAFGRGLVDAILATGDGRTPATAFIVLNELEPRPVLRLLGHQPGQPVIEQQGGHWLASYTVTSAETGAAAAPAAGPTAFRVWFNLDLPRTWAAG